MLKMKRGIFRHYKGSLYELVDVARHSETLEELVIYRNVSTGEYWARPVHMWDEKVCANGEEVLRFTFVSENI